MMMEIRSSTNDQPVSESKLGKQLNVFYFGIPVRSVKYGPAGTPTVLVGLLTS